MPSMLSRSCAAVLLAALVMAAAGCTGDPSGTAVLQAQETLPDRNPPAAAVKVNVYNDSEYNCRVQVDSYIGQVVVHHCEAVLEPLSVNALNASLLLGLDEADRVVVTCRIDGPDGTAIWSDQKTFRMGTDFADLDTVSYSIVYPPDSNTRPVASIQAPAAITAGRLTILDGSNSHDPAGDPLTYAWEQIAGPAVALSSAAAVSPTFTAPDVTAPTDLVFRLTVSDGQFTATQEVTVTIRPNRAPVAAVAAPASQPSGATVTLDGSGSYDPDGDPVTYRWEQVGATPATTVTLSSTTSPIVTFTAPQLIPGGATPPVSLTFQLTVADHALAASRQVTVVVVPLNRAPVAAIVPVPVVRVNQVVQLDGSGSLDVDKDPLTYQWVQLNSPPDPGVALLNADQPVASFTVPDTVLSASSLVFQLTVSDGWNPPVFATVDVLVGPVAVASAPETAAADSLVSLDGSASLGAGPLTYQWTQLEGGPYVFLSNADQAVATFYSPSTGGLMTFQLTVDDGVGSHSAIVSVYGLPLGGGNTPPIVDVTSSSVVRVGDTVTLDASYTYDLEGDPLTYQWRQLNSPPDPAVSLSGATSPVASFSTAGLSAGQVLTFEVAVSDGTNPPVLASASTVAGPLSLPTASAPVVTSGQTVTLSGVSSLAAGTPTYAWTQIQGTTVTLLPSASASTVTFTAPNVTSGSDILAFNLTVDDGVSAHTASVVVEVYSPQPVVIPLARTPVAVGDTVTLYGSASFSPAGGSLTYQWQQTAGTGVTLSATDQADVTFDVPTAILLPESLEFQLTITDSLAGSASAIVPVAVYPPGYALNLAPILTAGANVSTAAPGQLVSLTATTTDPDAGDIVNIIISPMFSFPNMPPPPSGPSPLSYSFSAPWRVYGPDNVLRFMVIAQDAAGGIDFVPVVVALSSGQAGDVNGDGVVNLADRAIVQAAMGTSPGDPAWDPRADIDGDGYVTSIDMQIVLARL